MQKILVLSAILMAGIQSHAQVESDFFMDTCSSAIVKNLVADYGVNNTDEGDDSNLLQTAIDEVSALGGGKIMLPLGRYYLTGIKLKDNVHIYIDAGTTIFPIENTGVIFGLGLERKGSDAAITIKCVSIRGVGGSYTVDLRAGIPDEKLWFANCRNVDNFMLADFQVLDHYTKMSSVTINVAWNGDDYYMARNGVVKNGDVENAHVGYGLIQVQCGQHILFKNIAGQGGVTLRLESGAVEDTPRYINIDDIWARKISSRYGSSCFIMGSHTKENGYANIKNAYSYSSGFGGGVGRGFVTEEEDSLGLTPGFFSPDCEIDSIHAVYGDSAQVKWKNFDLVPCPIRHLISEERTEDGSSYLAPSIAAMSYNDTAISLTNVTYEGFLYQNAIITKDDELQDCPPDALTISTNLLEVGTESGYASIDVTSNKDWTVDVSDDWVLCAPIRGSLNENLDISYLENKTVSERSATVTLSGGTASQVITVIQSGIPEELGISSSQLAAPYESGTLSFDIVSNTDWVIEESAEWMECTPLSGSTNAKVDISIEENTAAVERSDTITITTAGLIEELILTQAAAPVGISLRVFPNPGSELIYVTTGVSSSYQIYNLTGSELRSSINSDDHFEISLEGLESGMYFLRVRSEKGNCVETIIVQ